MESVQPRPLAEIATYIEVSNPDWCHRIGQALLLPWSALDGRSYRVERGVHELPRESLLKRAAIVALAILFYPLAFLTTIVGALLLASSKTYTRAFRQVEDWNIRIVWNNNKPEIRTQNLLLRPIKAEDLSVYQALFNNPIAMQQVPGGPVDITAKFHDWLHQWEEHLYSAFAVVKDDQVIGHAMIGHGDFEIADRGWSEMSLVMHPAYWNERFGDGERGVEGWRRFGSEAVRALIAYARALKERGALVPADVDRGQPVPSVNVHHDTNGAIDWAYLPLTELRASIHRHSLAAQRMGQTLMRELGVARSIQDAETDRFSLTLADV